MQLDFNYIDHAVVVSITGSVDALTADEMVSCCIEQIRSGQRWMIANLSGVDFMSSAGLRAIMNVTKEIRKQGGDFRLAAPQPGVGRVLSMSGFTGILKTYPTLYEAVDSFKGAAMEHGEAGE
jgi:anti-sigma B factor antagonist